MDKTAKQTPKVTTTRKPKTTAQRLKEKNLQALFSQLEVKHLENIINEAKNAIPKVKENEANAKAKKIKEEQQKLVKQAKKLGLTPELFIEYSGATATHTVSTTAPETK